MVGCRRYKKYFPSSIPYAPTDSIPENAPINAPLEETPFQRVSKIGAIVAAASKSATKNIPNTLQASNVKPAMVGPVAR
ncbi:MAG: Uncharacterised protein [Methanobacteriota archaeon]|nr:MAG: Uncharacterised protein [Euryarchaeota archaeon]